jgi:hypothetical protein
MAAAAVVSAGQSGAIASGNGTSGTAALAATNHVELSTNTSLGRLVLTARGSAPGSPVGLAFDNDSSLGQWKFVSLDGQFKRGMYVLRHTENTSAPQCLNAGLKVSVRGCDSSLEAQRWTLTGLTMKNDFERRIQPPDSPILVTDLRMGVGSGGQPITRTFTND